MRNLVGKECERESDNDISTHVRRPGRGRNPCPERTWPLQEGANGRVGEHPSH